MDVPERADDAPIDFDELLRAAGEIGVGAAILGLRRLNITRRRLVEQIPELEPFVDEVLDRIDELAAPASAAVGALVAALGDTMPGARGEQLHRSADLVASMGPELLRLSGLTRRE